MDTKQYWDRKHDDYAATDWIDKPSLFAEWALQYVPASGKLVDLGAGQGQDSRFFATHGFKVVSTDFSARALELGRQKAGTLPITFEAVDLGQKLLFADEEFDVVYSHLALHYFDAATTRRLFSDIHRILKPGGQLLALLNSDQDPEMQEGQLLEPDYVLNEGVQKRYFSQESAKAFLQGLEVIVLDNQGTTYKDEAKGVHNLIRLVAKKPKKLA